MGKIKYFTEEERKAAQKEAQKRWRNAHPDYFKEHMQQWRKENPEKEREKVKKYSQEHPEKAAERRKKYFKTPKGRASNLLTSYRQQDKNTNKGECTLTSEWIIENIFSKPCHYCGKEGWDVIGCDRIDNSKPHTPDNVVPCCWECNTKRKLMDYNEFYDSRKQLHKDKAIQ